MQNLSARNVNNLPEDITSYLMVQIVFCMFYVIIFVLGIVGNVLVVYVVARNRQMHTAMNLFIANLAISDVLLCVLAVPFTPLYTFLNGWVFGETLCHLVPYSQGVSVYIITLTLTGIAVYRFRVVNHPLKPSMKIKTCLAIIMSIWVIALLLTLPYGLYMQLDETYTFCEEHWPSELFRKVFSSLTSILQFIVPLFVIVFCYVRVLFKLDDQARAKPGTKTSQREEADRERKRRNNRKLIAMVAIFVVSWLPLNILNLVDDFYLSVNDWSYYRLFFFMSHFLAMSSTCINPYLYAWRNNNFRQEFEQVLPFYSRTRNSNGSTPRTKEDCRSEKIGNDNNTMQEILLPSNTKAQNPEECEMIILEQTTNISKKREDQPSSSSRDFDDTTV